MRHLLDRRSTIAIVILLSLFCVIALWKLASTSPLGKGDFMAYWSGTYLVSQGRNPYDLQNMTEVQKTLANSEFNYTVQTWNPPTLFVFMLPLGWLSFVAAKATWFVINVVNILIISLMLARLYLPQGSRIFVAFCLFVIVFPQV